MRRYVIVGAGAAGIAAAEAIRCHDPAGDILLISEEKDGFYSRPGLAYYLTGEITERQLYPFSEQDFRRLNAHRKHARAVRVHTQSHQLVFSDGVQLPYDRLLIATGAMAAPVKTPGSQLAGVVKLDNLEDARGILKQAHKGHSAVVVGGGITALEIVEGLAEHGVKVHYFLRGDRYWGNVLDEGESRIVERRLKEEGVQIYYQTEMVEILEKRGRVAGVLTKDGRQIKCDLVAIAIGVLARKELAEASGLDADRGVLVDEYLQTSAPDVFAAGDVAQVFDPASGKALLDSLWGPAREQGNAAGCNMAGLRTPYYKRTPFNVTRLARLTTTIIGAVGGGRDDDVLGIVRGDSEAWRQLPDAIAAQSDFDVNHLRVLVGERTLVGAILMGDQTLSRPLQQLVTERVDITPIHERLLQPKAPVGDLIAGFWTEWRSRHAA
jgi:NADPH-dependent 2,4-dienoyl-CoA reductase/sulfur reductase-like enzyme